MLKNLFQQQSLQEAIGSEGLLTDEEWLLVNERTSAGMSEVTAVSKEFGNKNLIHQALSNFLGLEQVMLRELPKIPDNVLEIIPTNMITSTHCQPAFPDSEQLRRTNPYRS